MKKLAYDHEMAKLTRKERNAEIQLIARLFREGYQSIKNEFDGSIPIRTSLFIRFMQCVVSAPDTILNEEMLAAAKDRDSGIHQIFRDEHGPLKGMVAYPHDAPFALGIALMKLLKIEFAPWLTELQSTARIRVDSPSGHISTPERIIEFNDPSLFTVIPYDDEGNAYAFNPMLSYGHADYEAMLSDENFDWQAFYTKQHEKLLAQLESGDIPLAHADYQDARLRDIPMHLFHLTRVTHWCQYCQLPALLAYAKIIDKKLVWFIDFEKACSRHTSTREQTLALPSGKLVIYPASQFKALPSKLSRKFEDTQWIDHIATHRLDRQAQLAPLNIAHITSLQSCWNSTRDHIYAYNIENIGLIFYSGTKRIPKECLPAGWSHVSTIREDIAAFFVMDVVQYYQYNHQEGCMPWYDFSARERKNCEQFQQNNQVVPKLSVKTRKTSKMSEYHAATINQDPGTYTFVELGDLSSTLGVEHAIQAVSSTDMKLALQYLDKLANDYKVKDFLPIAVLVKQ